MDDEWRAAAYCRPIAQASGGVYSSLALHNQAVQLQSGKVCAPLTTVPWRVSKKAWYRQRANGREYSPQIRPYSKQTHKTVGATLVVARFSTPLYHEYTRPMVVAPGPQRASV